MHTERYTFLRNELIELYQIFTKRTFLVTIPLAALLSTKELQHYQEHPPINGFDSLTMVQERPMTIERLLKSVMYMEDNFQIGFRNPRQDIPIIYESVQKWIQHWIEIKHNGGYLRTPDIKELELIEKLARYLFSAHAHYYHEKINRTLNVPNVKEASLLDILKGKMMYGDGFDEPISYISHLDQYKSDTNYRDYSGSMNSGTLDFLKGFGGGM